MGKKFKREFRGRQLTPEEVARDEAVRRKVQDEFPPATRAVGSAESLSETLKQAIRESDRSEYQIAKDAGISQIVITRFLSGDRDIRMATADKLAEALGLKLGVGV